MSGLHLPTLCPGRAAPAAGPSVRIGHPPPALLEGGVTVVGDDLAHGAGGGPQCPHRAPAAGVAGGRCRCSRRRPGTGCRRRAPVSVQWRPRCAARCFSISRDGNAWHIPLTSYGHRAPDHPAPEMATRRQFVAPRQTTARERNPWDGFNDKPEMLHSTSVCFWLPCLRQNMIFGWIPEAAPERGVSPPLRRRLLREALAPLSGAGFGRGGLPPMGRYGIVERTQSGTKR